MRSGLALILVCALVAVVGCTALEKALTPDPVTGNSPAVDTAKQLAPVADSFVPGLGEVLLGLALAAQNVFLLVKKQKSKNAKKTAAA